MAISKNQTPSCQRGTQYRCCGGGSALTMARTRRNKRRSVGNRLSVFSDTAWQEFVVSKQIYTATTGRRRAPDKDVISYLLIQSFEPGTITPEDANKLGYQMALGIYRRRTSIHSGNPCR